MATGDLTVTTVKYANMTLLTAAFDLLNSGGATAGADIKTFHITTHPNGYAFYLTTVTRAA